MILCDEKLDKTPNNYEIGKIFDFKSTTNEQRKRDLLQKKKSNSM